MNLKIFILIATVLLVQNLFAQENVPGANQKLDTITDENNRKTISYKLILEGGGSTGIEHFYYKDRYDETLRTRPSWLGISLIAINNIDFKDRLLLTSCIKEKDIPVKYYENVIGEGYVFEKYNDGTIMPLRWVGIQAREKQDEVIYGVDTDNYYHIDHLGANNNGKYTCRFLEKKRPSVWAWGWKIMKFYEIFTGNVVYSSTVITAETVREAAKKATKGNLQVIYIDTIWVVGCPQ